MSSDPQEISPGLLVNTYAGPAVSGSATRRRWQLTTPEGYIGLTYEQMCALRRWFAAEVCPAPAWVVNQYDAEHDEGLIYGPWAGRGAAREWAEVELDGQWFRVMSLTPAP